MEAALEEPGMVWNNVSTSRSFFLDDDGRHIVPHKFLPVTDNADCVAALERLVGRVDVEAVVGLIEGIPETAFGLEVMTPVMNEFYAEAARASLQRVILDSAEAQGIHV